MFWKQAEDSFALTGPREMEGVVEGMTEPDGGQWWSFWRCRIRSSRRGWTARPNGCLRRSCSRRWTLTSSSARPAPISFSSLVLSSLNISLRTTGCRSHVTQNDWVTTLSLTSRKNRHCRRPRPRCWAINLRILSGENERFHASHFDPNKLGRFVQLDGELFIQETSYLLPMHNCR